MIRDISPKRRVFDIIQIGNKSDFVSRFFDIFLVITILVNILVLFLRTFEGLREYDVLFSVSEGATVSVFIAEYILRIWTSEYLFPGKSKTYCVVHFLFSFSGIVDLLTILPFFFLSGFVVFRMLRVVRVFHLFRINAAYDSFNAIKSVLYDQRNQLLSSLFIIWILMLAASLFMYSIEHEAQPEVFKNAFSGIWWSVSTLLTVGYGDIYPVTPLGKAFAIVIAFMGVASVAVPTGIISAGFVEQYTKMQAADGSEDLSLGLQTVIVAIDSAWLGKTVSQIAEDYHVTVTFVRQAHKAFAPAGDYQIALGDVLAVYAPGMEE